MKRNKNRTKSLTNNIELVYEMEMQELAEAISENSQKTPILCDPFEDYIDLLRAKIHSNPHIFRSRLVKGYNALLHALQNDEDSSENLSKDL